MKMRVSSNVVLRAFLQIALQGVSILSLAFSPLYPPPLDCRVSRILRLSSFHTSSSPPTNVPGLYIHCGNVHLASCKWPRSALQMSTLHPSAKAHLVSGLQATEVLVSLIIGSKPVDITVLEASSTSQETLVDAALLLDGEQSVGR